MQMLHYLTSVVTLGLVLGQGPLVSEPPKKSTAERLAGQLENLQPQSNQNVSYYVAAAEAPPIPQLYISDQEAKDLCVPYARGHDKMTVTHPKTCSAHVLCTRTKMDNFKVDTVYIITANIFANAERTFWDQKSQTQRAWSSNNDCASDPCKTGKPITDGRNCSSYLTCVVAGETSSYQQNNCDDHQSFDVNTGSCVSDVTCRQPVANRYTNLYCNATVPQTRIPGLLPEAYYNRTFRDERNGTIYTVSEYCTASMVFDQSVPHLCKCIPASEAKCPKTLVQLDSELPAHSWYNAPEQDGRYSVEESNSQYIGWARFDGTEMSFYSAAGLANNELASDFSLQFRFAMPNPSSGGVALVSNSRLVDICPQATLSVYLNNRRNVVAEATNVMGVTATVESSGVNLSRANTISLKRSGGQLRLSVNGGPEAVSSGRNLGSYRLKSTLCGLLVGKRNGMPSLNGWVDKVKLVSLCPPPEQ